MNRAHMLLHTASTGVQHLQSCASRIRYANQAIAPLLFAICMQSYKTEGILTFGRPNACVKRFNFRNVM